MKSLVLVSAIFLSGVVSFTTVVHAQTQQAQMSQKFCDPNSASWKACTDFCTTNFQIDTSIDRRDVNMQAANKKYQVCVQGCRDKC